MTYTGLFDEDKKEKQIKKLKEDIKNQKIINTEHQKLNGKLRLEIEKLKKENEILYEGNDVLGIYVGGGVKEQLKKIVKSMIKDIELATPLIRKNPKGILFKTSIQSLARYAKRLNDLYQEMVKKIN
tara:strand:- start:62 stop:442 length:381 start_codon:yes stop_codon:yes gene_type:complete